MEPINRNPAAPRCGVDSEFFDAYVRLSDLGACDAPGGAEMIRVYSRWILEGQPADVDAFIRIHANAPPQ